MVQEATPQSAKTSWGRTAEIDCLSEEKSQEKGDLSDRTEKKDNENEMRKGDHEERAGRD
jgi:hypothetical protein